MTAKFFKKELSRMTAISCCKDCTPETGRCACDSEGRNCHSYCEKYLREKQEREEYKAKLNAKREKDRIIFGYMKQSRLRYLADR